MGKKVFLEVPINPMGLYGMTENVAARDDKNMKIYEFSYEEELLLWPLFYKFNDAFRIIIADYEEDIIMVKQLPEAINITQRFIENTTNAKTKENALKVLEALELALKLQMPVEFCF
jgi:hypothetical protein